MFALLRSFWLIGITSVLLLGLTACTHTTKTTYYSHASLSEGRQNFQTGKYKVAFSQLIPYAVKGNPEAEYAVGYMYYYGKGVDRNHEIAESWIKRAAKQGHPLAIKALATVNPRKRMIT